MNLKRVVMMIIGGIVAMAVVLAGIYYGSIWSNQLAPGYTKPAKMIEKWDGPGAAPIDNVNDASTSS